MIIFGSHSVLFVFAQKKRGVCALLGVNVWLHNIQCERCTCTWIFVALFFFGRFLNSTLGLIEASVRVIVWWHRRPCWEYLGSTFIYFFVANGNKRLLFSALFVVVIHWDKCRHPCKPVIYIEALRNMDALSSQGRVFFFFYFFFSFFSFFFFSTDDNKRLWLCVCSPTRPCF